MCCRKLLKELRTVSQEHLPCPVEVGHSQWLGNYQMFFFLPCFLDELQMLYEVEYGEAGDWCELYWPPGENTVVTYHPPIEHQYYNQGPSQKYTFLNGVMGILNQLFTRVW